MYEIEKLQELNFIVDNQIIELENRIKRTKNQIKCFKSIDFFQEEERELFFLNNLNDSYLNSLTKLQLKNIRLLLTKKAKEQNKLKKKVEELELKVKAYTNNINLKQSSKLYIETTEIIEEDENEIKETDLNQSIKDTVNNINTDEINIEEDINSNNTNHSYVMKKQIIPKLNLSSAIELNYINQNDDKRKKKDCEIQKQTNMNRILYNYKNYVSLNGNVLTNNK